MMQPSLVLTCDLYFYYSMGVVGDLKHAPSVSLNSTTSYLEKIATKLASDPRAVSKVFNIQVTLGTLIASIRTAELKEIILRGLGSSEDCDGSHSCRPSRNTVGGIFVTCLPSKLLL